MGDSDALLWTINRDPVLRTTVAAVLILDGPPQWDELVARVEDLVRAEPRLRSKVQAPGVGRGRPRWVEARTFDLSLHLRHVALPGGTLRTVLDFAQSLATGAFDPELPLWEATVVDGLASDRAALILKIHHAIVDGVGGLTALSQLLDGRTGRGSSENGPANSPNSRPPDVVAAFTSTAHRVVALPCQFTGLVARMLSDPRRVAREIGATSASTLRLLQPTPTPCSPVFGSRGIARRFEVLDLPAGALRAGADATGTTLNDMFVAGVLEGIGRYHELHGKLVDHVRVMMPVSIRAQDDELLGNRFVPARFTLPLGLGDIADRLEAVHVRAGTWKHSPALAISDAIAGILARLPSAVATSLFGGMMKGVDFVTTNVPGPAHETHIAGARVEAFYGFGPPSGAAVSVAMVTQCQDTYVSLNIDASSVSDPEVLAGCVQEGLDAVIRLGERPITTSTATGPK
jgi:diacylglycerol O-acyltransferase / wax synthase